MTGRLKKATTLALAIAAGFGMHGASQASALATAVLEVTNFQIQSTSGAILSLSDFILPQGLNSIVDNGTNSGSLNGVFANSTLTVTGGGPMDIVQACVGVVCPAQNNFGHTVPPPVAGNQLGRADSKLDGAPLLGLGQPTGANARTVAEVQLTSTGSGTGDSRLGLNTTFDFNLALAKAIRLDFDADLYLRAFLSSDVKSGLAQASSGLVFSIIQLGAGGAGTTIFEWAPNGLAGGITGGTELQDGENLNTTIAALVGGDNFTNDLPGSQHFRADTNVLGVGSYRFSIRHTNATDAQQVLPEPGTLLLAGGALLGLAALRRGKKAA